MTIDPTTNGSTNHPEEDGPGWSYPVPPADQELEDSANHSNSIQDGQTTQEPPATPETEIGLPEASQSVPATVTVLSPAEPEWDGWKGYTRLAALKRLKEEPSWVSGRPLAKIFESQCHARSKQAMQRGEPYIRCKSYAVPGMDVCPIHGGRTPVGAAAPHFRGRGYSKHMPKAMLAAYEQSLEDPELLSLKPEAALLDCRISELVRRLETGESGAAWVRIQTAMENFKSAMTITPAQGDIPAMQAKVRAISLSVAALDEAVKGGLDGEKSWKELQQVVENKARLTARENRRLAELQQTISIEQALAMFAALQMLVMEHLADRPEARRAIAEKLRPLLLGSR